MNRRSFLKQAAAVGSAIGAGSYFSGWWGKRSSAQSRLRPPGALPEEAFKATCIRCQRCVDACPNLALKPVANRPEYDDAGTPRLLPRESSCMLCQSEDGDFLKCTEVCPSGALQLVRKEPDEIRQKVRIGIAEIDLALCYSYNNWSCGACYRACPLAGEAMTLGNWERPVIHSDHCIGCGCCERSCIRYPHAIRVKGLATA